MATFGYLLNEKMGLPHYPTENYLLLKHFQTSSHYDTAIFNYFNREASIPVFRESINNHILCVMVKIHIRKGYFSVILEHIFTKLHGKELSYNNLLDLDAALNLIDEFTIPTYVIIKHNNACGVASRPRPT